MNCYQTIVARTGLYILYDEYIEYVEHVTLVYLASCYHQKNPLYTRVSKVLRCSHKTGTSLERCFFPLRLSEKTTGPVETADDL